MSPWDWFTGTASVDSLISTLGLGALAILFATDRIITKGQHLRRVSDLEEHYKARLVESAQHAAERLAEIRESRDHYRTAYHTEKARGDQATAVVAEVVELAKTTNQLLEAFDQTAREAGPDE